MRKLARFLGIVTDSSSLIFHSKRGGPQLETNILNRGLYPALEALGLEQAGMHAFRRGCNRRWELAGVIPAVIRQQMGHASAAMTALYRKRATWMNHFGCGLHWHDSRHEKAVSLTGAAHSDVDTTLSPLRSPVSARLLPGCR
jgi:integrase